jgi:hypothetical protein
MIALVLFLLVLLGVIAIAGTRPAVPCLRA